jgi:similar to spore coat protein
LTNEKLGIHETMELHELLTFKTLCATKSSTMGALVTDNQLKTLLQQDTRLSKQHISELQSILEGQHINQ